MTGDDGIEEEDADYTPQSGHDSSIPPGRPKQLPAATLNDRQGGQATGCGVLMDKALGRELNLDGTPKGPYRHSNHSTNRAEKATPQGQLLVNVITLPAVEELHDEHHRTRVHTIEARRSILSVKPAKLNISEFDGTDADSCIQNIEQFFESSRTPLDQRTEIAVF
ncbi:hypothetical protein D1007_35300 [Hordeum vulgare]|nr:hypothetical protein D1007_35300 [Hordeum vulgare]